MSNQTNQEISEVIENYFQGTFQASADMLKKAFHPDAHITGNFDGNYVDFPLDTFIERVIAMNEEGINKDYDKKIISMDIEQDIAHVKAKVLVGEAYFIDFITLINIDGTWVIRSKSFTNNV